ncbi:GmrSD restriction endonuclease domain-containing protein [Prosthecobacter dejongeii]|uniref:GmrSD restriction endonucleases N-terminal domain-containing protein n=1 Tax=Prosthecobacter dejongeii TaxID=48465 RepID=A0A7W8DNT1_9BACT|nr:DUF262 domain-containing protein [Prosthecobacter dejongeii]MBB5036425.1 hypothetical protein [Prosthecobacter dejongeii]
MPLEQEVLEGRQEIHTDAYSMSIGEIVNLYRDGELEIHPEFQREFRWKLSQKSRLIESILLGIPLPSIFVAQRNDGVWDVVDGLQRISTILSFMGELLDESGCKVEQLVLEKTPYLPSLEGVSWDNGMPDDLKRAFKREKFDVKIIKKESDENAKFELFQRLNTGGAGLSEQEVRNCLLLMVNRKSYEWLKERSKNENFINCLNLTDRLIDEKYEMELVLRFICIVKYDKSAPIDDEDMGPFLTTQMKRLMVDNDFAFENETKLFDTTFNILARLKGEDAFRRYSQPKQKHEGQFSVSLFECISAGVAFAIQQGQTEVEISSKLSTLVVTLADNPNFNEATKHGMRGINRLPKLVDLARELFR